MDDYRRITLVDAHRAELARQAEQWRLGEALPSRPAKGRTLLIIAVLFIGMIAWWIH